MADELKKERDFDLEGTVAAIKLLTDKKVENAGTLPNSVWLTLGKAAKKLDKEIECWLNPDKVPPPPPQS